MAPPERPRRELPALDARGEQLRAVVIAAQPRLDVVVYEHAERGRRQLRIQPSEPTKGKVRLVFEDLGSAPRVMDIVNTSGTGGWGTRMARALHAAYPNAQRWSSTTVLRSGARFWAKMQRELGIELYSSQGGVPLLDDETAADLIAKWDSYGEVDSEG